MNKQVKAELAFALSQLYDNHLEKVPAEILEEIKDFDMEIFEKFDGGKPFTQQDLSIETLEILAKIFKDIKN